MKQDTLGATGFLVLSFFVLFPQTLFASALSDIKIIKISTQDQSAVIKVADKLRLIKPGDLIGESGRVLEIDKTRIVVEESGAQVKELVIIYFENGKQRLERISKGAVPSQTLYAPQTVVEQ
ncbi:MAG: hypothetical protein EHM45_20020 [Desulfobacteraceae bacterium]|nr:MAG: hypothetical protein EHM45_20020 [Desulfobacteraceae bacterium]